MKLLLGWLLLAGAVMVTVSVVPGIDVDWSPGTYLAITVVFALLNVTLGSVLQLLSAPLLIVTMGLFSLVLNAILLLVTDWLMDSLEVDGFWAALAGAVVIALIATGVAGLTRTVETEPRPAA